MRVRLIAALVVFGVVILGLSGFEILNYRAWLDQNEYEKQVGLQGQIGPTVVFSAVHVPASGKNTAVTNQRLVMMPSAVMAGPAGRVFKPSEVKKDIIDDFDIGRKVHQVSTRLVLGSSGRTMKPSYIDIDIVPVGIPVTKLAGGTVENYLSAGHVIINGRHLHEIYPLCGMPIMDIGQPGHNPDIVPVFIALEPMKKICKDGSGASLDSPREVMAQWRSDFIDKLQQEQEVSVEVYDGDDALVVTATIPVGNLAFARQRLQQMTDAIENGSVGEPFSLFKKYPTPHHYEEGPAPHA